MTATKTRAKTKRIIVPPAKPREPERLFREEPVRAPRSVFWTVIGLIEGDGWYELYQAKTEGEGKRYLMSALDDTSPHMEKFDDFGLYPPQVETKRRREYEQPAAPKSIRTRATAVKRKK